MTDTAARHYDAIVIGAGQGGVPLAAALARAGRRTALVERVHVGGTCVNDGCTPTKTMIASARAAYIARRGPVYGVPTGAVSVDLARVRERKQAMVDNFRNASEDDLARAGVEIVRGSARFTGARTIEVSGTGGPAGMTADLVFIDTGLRPAIPRIAGLDQTPYLTSTSIMELTSVPAHLIVLGGGYVGLEFAQMFRRFGSRVTILQRGARLLEHEDDDVSGELERILTGDGIQVVLGARATAASAADGSVTISYQQGDSPEAAATVNGSHLLVATGRRPNTDDLDLAAGEIETDERGFIRTNDRLETSAPGVYALGDVTGGAAFTHVSYDDFRILRANILQGGHASRNGRMAVYTIFTDPQLGRAGMTEREARNAGRSFSVARLPMSDVARALEVDETRGFIKVLVDPDSGLILGVAALAIEGGEIAALLQVAMMGQIPFTLLRDGMFAHPTLAESLNNLFDRLERVS